MSGPTDKWHCREAVYTKLIKEVQELNSVLHYISKQMEVNHDQQNQTDCGNLNRR